MMMKREPDLVARRYTDPATATCKWAGGSNTRVRKFIPFLSSVIR
ncbi:UNVERIFIED_ORG: hypothetical protein BCL66_103273 [Martelella mediterranea]